MAFRAQWNNFVNKMKSEQRSNLDLYYSLLKVLDGRAKDFVSTKYPSDQSYAQAIAKLDEHFYNPTIQLRDMIRNLLKGQKMSDTYDSLLSGITKLNDGSLVKAALKEQRSLKLPWYKNLELLMTR